MSFLDEMRKKKKELTSPKHPLCDEELRLREAYATGVALLMARADEQFCDAEIEHLKELAASLNLTDDPAERIAALVEEAGAEILDSIVPAIEKQDHKYLFILDLYRAAHVDGKFLPEEQEMIDLFAEMLGLKQVETSFLKHFADGLVSGDKDKMQESLYDAYHFCLELPMEVFTYFHLDLMAIPESQVRDLAKVEKAASQGIPEAQCLMEQERESAEEERKREEFDRLVYTDIQTGMMWLRNGNLAGNALNWNDAIEWVKNLEYGGFNDWRLPTLEELISFIKRGNNRPADMFNINGFSSIQANGYWSSNDVANRALGVNMYDGSNGHADKSGILFVWPVRSGQF